MRRKNHDFPDKKLQKIGGWVRLRDEGDRITLTYKQMSDRSIHGTQEVEVTIDSFEEGEQILAAIGLEVTSFQETRRNSWEYKGSQIELDEWPWVHTQLEIEGESEELVREIAKDLGLEWSNAKHGSVEIAYMDVFDFEEEKFYDLDTISFDAKPPKWLEETRR